MVRKTRVKAHVRSLKNGKKTKVKSYVRDVNSKKRNPISLRSNEKNEFEILGVLSKDFYILEKSIKKRIKRKDSLYNDLKRMEREGLIKSVKNDFTNNKRVYYSTESGMEKYKEKLYEKTSRNKQSGR